MKPLFICNRDALDWIWEKDSLVIIRVIVCPSVLSRESMESAFLVVKYVSRYSWACVHGELGLGSLFWSISSLQKYSAQTTCFSSTEEII